MIFYREKIEAADNSMDDELQRKCRYDIDKFCPNNQNGENVLDCLTNMKIVRLLQPGCRTIVQERMREAARDIRLRPGLLSACKSEAET
ncbi:cysteine rich repeat-containing domain protein [Oesophagostomum dentatum]|uniref:Cysteine rich repeat-containing domain protein n=1 Tax=Oesophagostomum dentatum TaxID=61180 RepID=A0A0B1SFU5_OESDE|nr:cysteine rich repeat-containing domain protein [Oesophagostomum dentatum]